MHKEYATEWLALEFDTQGDTVIQDEEDWIDLEDFKSLTLTLIVPVINTATVTIETARAKEGPWTSVTQLTSAPDLADGYATFVTCGVGTDVVQDQRLDRYTRLRFEATGATGGRVCLRMTGIMKA